MTKDETDVVSAVRTALAGKVGLKRYELWFGDGATRLAVAGEALIVRAANPFAQEFVRLNFATALHQVCRDVLGRVLALQYQVEPPAAQDSARVPESSLGDDAAGRDIPVGHERHTAAARLPRRFASFDSLAVGTSNRVAVTAARMLVDQPGCFSSLFLHGPTGVGKTHLLEAIWTAVRRRPGSPRVVYLSAEQFTTHFVEAARGSGLPNFRRKHRGAALLALDDVQFFANKKQTLVEVLYTVDNLLREGQQVIFAADRPPQDLQCLGPELVARFTAGAVCRIDSPELELRVELARRRAAVLGMEMPDDVLTLIAGRICASARELNGALHHLLATSQALGQPITAALAETALADVFLHATQTVRLTDVERAVCDVFGLDAETLHSSRRQAQISHPRMLAMWLARKYTRSALSEIGDHFGGRKHATVISAQKKVDKWLHDGTPLAIGGTTCAAADVVRRLEQSLNVRTG